MVIYLFEFLDYSNLLRLTVVFSSLDRDKPTKKDYYNLNLQICCKSNQNFAN